mmetsp:Transcript_97383/g.270891  ORF Transcript_97383/g.270891 Transcript_97383/m.270891 type:complete len:256 (-) Transcript_97383:674-1441(-)
MKTPPMTQRFSSRSYQLGPRTVSLDPARGSVPGSAASRRRVRTRTSSVRSSPWSSESSESRPSGTMLTGPLERSVRVATDCAAAPCLPAGTLPPKMSPRRSSGSTEPALFFWICKRHISEPSPAGTRAKRSGISRAKAWPPTYTLTGSMFGASCMMEQLHTTTFPAAGSTPHSLSNTSMAKSERTKGKYFLGGARRKEVPVSNKKRDFTGFLWWIANPPEITQNLRAPPGCNGSTSAQARVPSLQAEYGTSPATK